MISVWWMVVGCQTKWGLQDNDGDGFTWLQGDCDDENPEVFPSAVEVCDSVDNNCNGETDSDAAEALTWYGDIDGDGFTGDSLVTTSCSIPDGYTAEPTDCDDSNSAINPEALEYCNGIDDNCNGAVDENGAVGASTYYADADGDGYGDAGAAIAQCTQGSGVVTNSADCDDTTGAVYPDAAEICDEIDNDCDGLIDDEDNTVTASTTWYIDIDGDGFGSSNSSVLSCAPPEGFVETRSDCDDTDATIYPDSPRLEVPQDGTDVDCNGADYCTDLSCDGRPDVFLPLWIDDGGEHGLESPVYLSTELTSSHALKANGALSSTAADLNVDGYLDLIIVSGRDDEDCISSSMIYWGSDSGLDSSTSLATIGARDVAAADLDGNYRKDLVFASGSEDCTDGETPDGAVIHWGSNAGFNASNVSELGIDDTWKVDIADLDGNGESDILLCRHLDDGSYSASSMILWWEGGDHVESTQLATEGCADQVIADLDDDGLLDVVFANYRTDTGFDARSYVYWNDGDRFGNATLETLDTTAAWSVQAADLDADGFPELVIGALVDLTDEDSPVWELDTEIFWNNSGSFSTPTGLQTPGSPYPAVADLDGDGLLEVVVAGYRTDDAYPTDETIVSYIYWGSDGYDVTTRTTLETEGAWHASVADFDEDGFPDILASGYFNGQTYAADSRVYWGASGGFTEANTTDLAVTGAVYGAPLIVGD